MATIVCQCTTTSSFLVWKLGFYMHGSCSPAYMANTATNTWQPVCSSIKTLHSRLELTRQMRSTISAAHMLLAIGKSRRQYMSHCTRPLVSVFCLIFSTITATNLLFLTCYSHKNKCSVVFVVQMSLPCCAACAHLVCSVTPNWRALSAICEACHETFAEVAPP